MPNRERNLVVQLIVVPVRGEYDCRLTEVTRVIYARDLPPPVTQAALPPCPRWLPFAVAAAAGLVVWALQALLGL